MMTIKRTHKENGLTLIELLVTLTIISLILMAIYTFYLAGLQSWKRSNDQIEQQQNARIAIDKIVRELRFAYEVNLHDENREVRFKILGESRTLRFRLVGREIVFDSHPTGQFNSFHTKIALEINDLRFTIDPAGVVTVIVCAGNDTKTFSLTSSIRPRNLPGGGL